ncbi:3-ketoacyl-ACP reductase [Aquabacterium sp. NJ1]|uniref:SDR family NAD(P)-dependent oxidoreductase n=1 Tax=Aquabacterium sp. NJ1 TaxID=1538295 RepID=UPI00052BF62B|nr:SDR family oxidoreductase [Aquabacterium sp. NJ1]KGM41389.1 3-ketoacyl-ACP reductase [Aquabacterium sp. NJ1]
MNRTRQPVAVVTGGATGIGRATSEQLAAMGCIVVVVYSRSEAEAVETVATIRAKGQEATAMRADVVHDDQVKLMVANVVERHGGIDYLVNNAGATRQLPFADLDLVTDAIWDELFAVNVKAAFNCSRAAAPYLRQRPGSAIVNVGSIAGETGYGSSLPYAVSKAALHGMTRSLARALAPDIRVNCIAPGAVDTRWWAGLEAKMWELAGHLPLQRISTPQDIAETIWGLLTARSITGQIVKAENGQTL